MQGFLTFEDGVAFLYWRDQDGEAVSKMLDDAGVKYRKSKRHAVSKTPEGTSVFEYDSLEIDPAKGTWHIKDLITHLAMS